MAKRDRTPSNRSSEVSNPNSKEHQAMLDNRFRQIEENRRRAELEDSEEEDQWAGSSSEPLRHRIGTACSQGDVNAVDI